MGEARLEAAVSGHDDCRRATVTSPEPGVREWRCYYCGDRLATGDLNGIRIEPPLAWLPRKVDGLLAFGLPQRSLTKGNQPHSGGAPWSERRLPLVGFCKRDGICGRKQHLH